MELAAKTCVPCEGGVPRLTPDQVKILHPGVPSWAVDDDGGKLRRRFEFPDFIGALGFVNAMAALAEQEQHHPDFCVKYSLVDVTIYTHAIGGLSENDFILAAKIDQIDSGKMP